MPPRGGPSSGACASPGVGVHDARQGGNLGGGGDRVREGESACVSTRQRGAHVAHGVETARHAVGLARAWRIDDDRILLESMYHVREACHGRA